MVVSEVGTVEMGTKLRHMVLQNLEALRVTFRAADPKGSGQLLMGVRSWSFTQQRLRSCSSCIDLTAEALAVAGLLSMAQFRAALFRVVGMPVNASGVVGSKFHQVQSPAAVGGADARCRRGRTKLSMSGG